MMLLFRNRSFGILWLAQVLSQGGTRMNAIAFMWWLVTQESSRTGVWIALFALAAALPGLLLAKPIGRLIDRYPLKPILIYSDLFSFLIVGLELILLWANLLSPGVLVACTLLSSLGSAIFEPAVMKSTPLLVEKADVEAAVAHLGLTTQIAGFAGAVIGATLVAILGMFGTTLINALSFLIGAIASMQVRFVQPLTENFAPTASQNDEKSILKELAPQTRIILFTFAAINFFATPIVIILPVFVKKQLSGNPTDLALLEAFLWLGFVMGSLFAAKVFPRWSPLKTGTLFLVAFGLSYIAMGSWPVIEVSCAALAIGGFLLSVNNVKFITLFHSTVREEIKGRFFAILTALCGASFPIAFMVFGILADQVQASAIILAQGIGICLAATPLFYVLRSEREII